MIVYIQHYCVDDENGRQISLCAVCEEKLSDSTKNGIGAK